MSMVFETLKGRVILGLLLFLSASHLIAVWLYVQRSNDTTTLLHDAMLADRIAFVSRLVAATSNADRAKILAAASGPLVKFTEQTQPDLGEQLPEGSRPHLFEHLIGVFLKRQALDGHGLRMSYLAKNEADGLDNLLATVNASASQDADHLPERPLAEIRPDGAVRIEIDNRDGTWLRVNAPLLTVSPFSPFKIGTSLAALVASVLAVAFWALNRWTQPLTTFALAAERLGVDIAAPSLPETGLLEIRSASRAFNVMQARLRRFVEDRTAFAAAIAHDLGTPITRLQLRAEEIENAGLKERIARDLDQMRRMITATLDFARTDLVAETIEIIDLVSLAERVRDDLLDLGADVSLAAPKQLIVRSKPVSLRRALANVTENAIKYGARARIFVSTDRATNLVRVRVEDDGPGIPIESQEIVFRPFARLEREILAEIEGTGLGLPAARSIVRGLGGDIALGTPQSGKFAVTISLPLSD